MADKDDDIERLKQLVLKIEKERQLQGDDGVPFDVAFEKATTALRREPRTLRYRLKKIAATIGEKLSERTFRFVYRYSKPVVDDALQRVLEIQLQVAGKLSASDLTEISRKGIVRRGEDGVPEVVGPSKTMYLLSKGAIALLIVTHSPLLVLLLEDPFCFWTALPGAYLLGCSIGGWTKAAYAFSWGRERLARKLTYLWPAFRYRVAPI